MFARLLNRLMDLLFPWRAPLREARHNTEETNRALMLLIESVERSPRRRHPRRTGDARQ